MHEQKIYLVINAVPNTDDLLSFQSYLSQIMVIFNQFGGIQQQRFKTLEQVMGNGGIKAIAVFEFPDTATIKEMLASDTFNALNDLRKKAYKQDVDLMICEEL